MSIPPRRPSQPSEDASLNPALKQVRDASYGPDQSGTDPMTTISVKKDEGTWWPAIWAASAIVGVIITILLVIL